MVQGKTDLNHGFGPFSAELKKRRNEVRAGAFILLMVRSFGWMAGLLLLMMVVDLIWVPDSATRETLLTLAAVIWLAALTYGVVSILRRSWKSVASMVDGALNNVRRPVLSGYELMVRMKDGQRDASRGMGDFLMEMQLQEACGEIKKLSVRELLPLDMIGRSALFTSSIAGVILVLFLFWHAPLSITLKRLLFPSMDIPPYSKIVFTVSPGNCDIMYGSGTNLSVEVENADNETAVWMLTRSGNRQRRSACFGLDQNRFGQNLEKVVVPLEYCFKAGRARSPWYVVNLRLQPRVESVELMIAPPEYAGLNFRKISPSSEPVEILSGSDVKLFVKSNRPLSRGIMQLEPLDGTSPIEKVAGVRKGTNMVCFEWKATTASKLEAWIYDLQGNASYKPVELLQNILPDRPPEVRLHSPPPYILATPDAVIEMEGEISDDYGVDHAELIRGLVGFRDRSMVVAKGRDPRLVQFSTQLELEQVGVAPGQILEFFVEAFDTNPAMDGFGASQISRVKIISRDAYTLMLREQSRIEDFMARYRIIEQNLRDFNDSLDALEKAADQDDEALREEAVRQTRELAQKTSAMFKKLADDFVIYEVEKELKLDLLDAASELEDVDFELSRVDAADAGLSKIVGEIRERLKSSTERLSEKVEQAERISKVMELLEQGQEFGDVVAGQRFLVRSLERIKKEHAMRSKARLLQAARDQQEILNLFKSILEKIREKAAEVPEDYKDLAQQAEQFVKALESSNVEKFMKNCEVAGRNNRPSQAHREAVKALELLEKLLEKMCRDGNCMAQAANGMLEDCNGGGECERLTLKQMLEASRSRKGSGSGMGGAGEGMASGSAEGMASGGNTPQNVPVIGPPRSRPTGSKQGSGEGEGEGAGRRSVRMSDEREVMTNGSSGSADGHRLPVEQVPRKYKDAVRSYFEGDKQ